MKIKPLEHLEPLELFMEDYSDIINLPHHVSKKHPQMSMWSRAAQFAPFAALSGHNEVIKETARENEISFTEKEEPQV